MSNGRRDLWEYYLSMSTVEFLNTLAFFKELGEVEANENKKTLL